MEDVEDDVTPSTSEPSDMEQEEDVESDVSMEVEVLAPFPLMDDAEVRALLDNVATRFDQLVEERHNQEPRQLVLCATSNDLHLLDFSRSPPTALATRRELLRAIDRRQYILSWEMDRLSIMEWFPGLSAAIVASQKGLLGIVRVER
jgi:hypothetical protein